MALDPGVRRLLGMLAASGAPASAAGGVAERRRMLQALARIAGDPGSADVEARELEAPGPAGPIPLRLYEPRLNAPSAGIADSSPAERGSISRSSAAERGRWMPPQAGDGGGVRPSTPALVYLHGGGWVAGGFDTHDGLCRRLAARSCAKVIAVDYRLAPEHRFPAAYEDALAAVRWVSRQAAALGVDPGRLAVGGDSAGGGLAAAVAQSAQAPPLALVVLLCPILDVARETASRRAFADGFFVDTATLAEDLLCYAGADSDLSDPRLSPLLAADLAGLPPTLVHVAEHDPFRDEGQAYAERLSQAGTPVRFACWPGMIHYFYGLARAIPAARAAVDAIGAEIADALAAQSLSSPRAMRAKSGRPSGA